jgi:hypothetical protein
MPDKREKRGVSRFSGKPAYVGHVGHAREVGRMTKEGGRGSAGQPIWGHQFSQAISAQPNFGRPIFNERWRRKDDKPMSDYSRTVKVSVSTERFHLTIERLTYSKDLNSILSEETITLPLDEVPTLIKDLAQALMWDGSHT